MAETATEAEPELTVQQYQLEDVSLGEWYQDVVYFLLNHKCPSHLQGVQKRALRLKRNGYMLRGSILYKKNHEGVYLRCLGKEEAERVLREFHDKFRTGHGSGSSTAHQILRAGYYWPTVFKDSHGHVHSCHTCQTTATKERNAAVPLQPVLEVRPFAQWGLDFIGPVSPPSSAGHRYILTTIDYCTRWTEAIVCKHCTTEVVTDFLESFILNRFGCPYALVCDNGPAFASLKFASWAFDYGIALKFSSNYYPQGNGLTESTNKNLITVIKKLLDRNPKD